MTDSAAPTVESVENWRPMRDLGEGIEAQERCGHWGHIAEAYQLAHVAEGFCPPCKRPLDKHKFATEHGHCRCCGRCWSVVDGTVGLISHPPIEDRPSANDAR